MLDPVLVLFRGLVSDKRDDVEMCRLIYHMKNRESIDEHFINLDSMVQP